MRHAGVVAFVFVVAVLSPGFAAAYDDGWYEAGFWSGEYPDGFSVTADVTIAIHSEPDPAGARDVDCAFRKGAVYHPWNAARVESDGLTFKSFTLKTTYTVASPLATELMPEDSEDPVTIDFAAGDKWTYLAYLGEGAFLMDRDGTVYIGEQDLIESSEPVLPEAVGYDEWMRLTCANGATGWVYLPDVVGRPEINEPNILGYGEAADLGD